MDYFNNEPFIDQLNPDKHIEQKNSVNMVLVILLITSLYSMVLMYNEMTRYKKELAHYKNLGQRNDDSTDSLN